MKNRYLSKMKAGIMCLTISYICLIPGLILPMVTISGYIKVLTIRKTLFNNSRSVIQTLSNLFESENYLVFALILSFSIMVPLLKGFFLITAFRQKNRQKTEKVITFIGNISKWAMADVFVVGIFVAFLSARATDNMDAILGTGFYFFSAYCLLSLLSLHLFKRKITFNQKKVVLI